MPSLIEYDKLGPHLYGEILKSHILELCIQASLKAENIGAFMQQDRICPLIFWIVSSYFPVIQVTVLEVNIEY